MDILIPTLNANIGKDVKMNKKINVQIHGKKYKLLDNETNCQVHLWAGGAESSTCD